MEEAWLLICFVRSSRRREVIRKDLTSVITCVIILVMKEAEMNKRKQKAVAEAIVALLAKGTGVEIAGLSNELHAAAGLWKPEDETLVKLVDALTVEAFRRLRKEQDARARA